MENEKNTKLLRGCLISGRLGYKLFFLYVLSLCVRLQFFIRRGTASLVTDSYEYLALARNLVKNGVYSLSESAPYISSIRRAPLYPVFLSLFSFGETQPLQLIIIVQYFIDAAACISVFYLARRIMPPGFALLAAGLVALFHGTSASSIGSETLFTGTLLVVLNVLCKGLDEDHKGWVFAGGIGLGLVSLCRPIMILIPIPILVCLCIARSPKRCLSDGLLLIAGFTLVLAPWAFRCSRLAGGLVLVQGYSAANFYLASLSHLDQRDYAAVWKEFNNSEYGLKLNATDDPREIANADRIGWKHTWENIKASPKRYVVSRLRSWPHLFLSSYDGATGVDTTFSSALAKGDYIALLIKLTALGVLFLAPLLLALVSLCFSYRNVVALVCASIWVYTLLIHIPLWIELRFWLPVVPVELISAVYGAYSLRFALAKKASFISFGKPEVQRTDN